MSSKALNAAKADCNETNPSKVGIEAASSPKAKAAGDPNVRHVTLIRLRGDVWVETNVTVPAESLSDVSIEDLAHYNEVMRRHFAKHVAKSGKPVREMTAQQKAVIQEIIAGFDKDVPPTNVIGRIEPVSRAAKFAVVPFSGDDEARTNDSFFRQLSTLNESGQLALVPTETKDVILRLIAAALAPDAQPWTPSESWNPKQESSWAFYCRVYKDSKDKPAAHELLKGDPRLYSSLAAKCSRNKAGGAPNAVETPHHIRDLFPLRRDEFGRTLRPPSVALLSDLTAQDAMELIAKQRTKTAVRNARRRRTQRPTP